MKRPVITTIVIALVFALVIPTACGNPAKFEVSALNISPSEVGRGEPTTITVDVENIGGSEGTYIATLKIDEVEAETKEITLDAGAKETVSFSYSTNTLGTYKVELNGLAGTLAVVRPAELEVASLEVTPALVLPGQEATVKTDVANVGDVTGALKVTLEVNGVETDMRSITLAANATDEVSFTMVRDLPGTYDISVGEVSASLNVPEVETYHSDTYNYSISYPRGWRLEETIPEMVGMAKIAIGGISIATEYIPVDMSLEEYWLISVDNAENLLPGFELLSQTEVIEDGAVVGYNLLYEITQEGIAMTGRCYVTKRGGYGFAVTGMVRKSVYEINKPLLDACIDSFTPPVVAVGSYTNTTHGFSLTLPSGWDAMETGDTWPLLDIGSPFGELLVFGDLRIDRIYETTTAEEYASDIIAEVFSQAPGFQVISVSEVTLGANTRGYNIVYEDTWGDMQFKNSFTVVIRGSQAFTIELYALDWIYDSMRSDIDNIVRSFTLVEPRPFGVSRQNSLFLSGGEIVTLDPALGEGSPGWIIGALFSGLVRIDKDLKVVPDIAKNWEISDDGTVYTFHLREGVKFHDGKPVTAADFKYSWERACDPETESKKARLFLGDIMGAKEMLVGEATELSGVKVIDDRTLEVTIDGPKPYFLGKLAYLTAFVVDRANVARGMNWTDKPNGTGPFKLKEWKKDELLILERNADYYLEPAKLGNIVFQIFAGRPMMMYEQGEIDRTGVGLYDLERVLDPASPLNKELLTTAGINTGYLGFNVTMPPFDDPKVRRAFALALDMDKILEVSLKGNAERASGFVPPGIPGHNEELEPLPFDPEQAKQLIGESKYGSVDNLPPIVFYDLYSLGSAEEAMIGMWQANLGVTVEVQIIEELEEWLERRHRREFPIFVSGWQADYIDPQNFLEILFHSQSEDNDFAYSNPEVDAALEKAAVERDEDVRLAMYQEIEKMILVDLPGVPFYQSTKRHVLVKPYVEGYYLAPIGIRIWQDISIKPH